MCGLMDATGAPDGTPTLVGDSVSDVVSGIFASWGVLAVLLARERTGKGTYVDVAMFDATLGLTAALVARYATTGIVPRRVGNRHPSSAPFGAYRAKDGHFVVAVLNNRLFEPLAHTIGQPGLIDDARSWTSPSIPILAVASCMANPRTKRLRRRSPSMPTIPPTLAFPASRRRSLPRWRPACPCRAGGATVVPTRRPA